MCGSTSPIEVIMASYEMKSQGSNPYKVVQDDRDSSYATPGALELEEMFWTGVRAQYTHVNEVWPNIYIGDEKTALEQDGLQEVGITHIVNAAEGEWNNVLTGAVYYKDMDIQYYGIEADDTPTFNMSQYFYPAARFIQHALSLPHNKVLVHCVMGRSRSATLVLAYLMVEKGLTVVDAISHVRQRRCILPNRGFLRQLRTLDIALQERLGKRQHTHTHTHTSAGVKSGR